MILDKIVEDKKIRLVEHKKAVSLQDIRNLAEKTPTRKKDCFYNNLKKNGISIIGEFHQALAESRASLI